MDSDGQHPANLIARFMAASQAQPDAMVLGLPKFDSKAPKARVYGRRLSNVCANLETLWSGIGDSLYGFRVYPVVPLRDVMSRHVWMRRFDFDPEAAVRLCWEGVRPIQIEAPVRYFRADEGGVSHFNYLRDNLLLSWMHLRLFFGFLLRLPVLIRTPRPTPGTAAQLERLTRQSCSSARIGLNPGSSSVRTNGSGINPLQS